MTELACAECVWPEFEAPQPMRGYLGREGEAENEVEEVVVLCDECAQREELVE